MKNSERTKLTISKILEAAINEFGRNGYAGGTVNNICSTGINKGLIYHNFEGKDELYITCLKHCCRMLINHLNEEDRTENMETYMSARIDFFREHPNEAHIVFEAILSPPAHLIEEVNRSVSEFNLLNEKMYFLTLDSVCLRDEVSREDAIAYFHLMQTMLNGYFSSPVFQNTSMSEKVELHEMTVSKLLNYMLYGIAKGEKK